MREIGLPKLRAWRWAPCAAFVLGSLSFITFALVAIPDHIGHVEAEATSNALRLDGALARTQLPVGSPSDWTADTTNTAASSPNPGAHSPEPSAAAQNADGTFPKRGFTPPLERPEPPPPPPPPPQPQLTPLQQQPQLNLPPPVPAPAPAPAAEPPSQPAPAQPEGAAEVSPPPSGDAAPAPAPSAEN